MFVTNSQRRDTQHNDSQLDNTLRWCSGSLLIYCYAECQHAKCLYTEYHYNECHYAECHYAECQYAECHYAECHYAQCHGTFKGKCLACASASLY
jgi:hypothetical protein